MKTMLLGLVILALSGCGKGLVGTTSVDPAFQGIAETFEQEAASRGLDYRVEGLTVEFGAVVGGDVLGSCETGLQGRHIVIDSAHWQNLSDSQREQLLFHEFGHCILNRSHTSETTYNPELGEIVPVSIMSPSQLNDGYYVIDRAALLDELFGVSE